MIASSPVMRHATYGMITPASDQPNRSAPASPYVPTGATLVNEPFARCVSAMSRMYLSRNA